MMKSSQSKGFLRRGLKTDIIPPEAGLQVLFKQLKKEERPGYHRLKKKNKEMNKYGGN